MKFVIAGTGRSGTKWAAAALRSAGWLCGHEQVFPTDMLRHAPVGKDGFSEPTSIGRLDGGPFDGDSSLAAMPWLPYLSDDVRKVLLVRHPLDVVASLLATGPLLAGSQPVGLMKYLHREMPDVVDGGQSEVDAAARYWMRWNLAAARHADTVLRLEDATVDVLCQYVRVEPRWPTFPMAPVNCGPGDVTVRLDMLTPPVRGNLVAAAEMFGYDL